MSSDDDLEMLTDLVQGLGPATPGSALLDEVDERLGHSVSGNALMWFALDREPGNFELARALVRARYLVPNVDTVDEVMAKLLNQPKDP